MSKLIDMTGKGIGRWKVLECTDPPNDDTGRACWLCQCDCGNRAAVYGTDMRAGKSLSCGCSRQHAPEPSLRQGETTYHAWYDMLTRADRRGVPVVKKWRQFACFLADMGRKPENTRLARYDRKKGFHKVNCYWQPKSLG